VVTKTSPSKANASTRDSSRDPTLLDQSLASLKRPKGSRPWGAFFAAPIAVQRPLALALGTSIGALVLHERRQSQRTRRLAAAALETLLNAIDANDSQSGAHVRRVAAYSMTLARAAGVARSLVRSVERVALFHDIGKIHEALFDIVHDEDDDVTPEERELIATHPQRGADVLAPLSFFYPDLAEGVLAHHERWDGSGYPRGLRGEEIPIQARVVAIGDTFDAITYGRRYRRPHTLDQGIRVIAESRGKQFDPRLVDVFLEPDVLARIRGIARENWRRTTTSGDDRRRDAGAKVPDVTFRWRDGPLTSPP
jgi:response regulator RpfG family c-di-GMP phosphodiesterase